MAVRFDENDVKILEGIRAKYPNNQACTLPFLHYAQDKFGYVSMDVIKLVAQTLNLPVAHVLNVATFYTMFNKKPVGKYHLQICTNISCSLLGARRLVDKLQELLGIKPGETTEDGMFTLTEVECLGSCGTAPVIQVNDTYFENLDEKKVEDLIESLRKGELDV